MAARRRGRAAPVNHQPAWLLALEPSITGLTQMYTNQRAWSRQAYLDFTAVFVDDRAVFYNPSQQFDETFLEFLSLALGGAVAHITSSQSTLQTSDLSRVLAPLVALAFGKPRPNFSAQKVMPLLQVDFDGTQRILKRVGSSIFTSVDTLLQHPLPFAANPVVQWQLITLLTCLRHIDAGHPDNAVVVRALTATLEEIESVKVLLVATEITYNIHDDLDNSSIDTLLYLCLRALSRLSISPTHQLYLPIRRTLVWALFETWTEPRLLTRVELLGYYDLMLDCALSIGVDGYIAGLDFTFRVLDTARKILPSMVDDLLRTHAATVGNIITGFEAAIPLPSVSPEKREQVMQRITRREGAIVLDALYSSYMARREIQNYVLLPTAFDLILEYCRMSQLELFLDGGTRLQAQWILDTMWSAPLERRNIYNHTRALWRVLVHTAPYEPSYSRLWRVPCPDLWTGLCDAIITKPPQYDAQLNFGSMWGIAAFLSRFPEGCECLLRHKFHRLFSIGLLMTEAAVTAIQINSQEFSRDFVARNEKAAIESFRYIRDVCMSLAFFVEDDALESISDSTAARLFHVSRALVPKSEVELYVYAALLMGRHVKGTVPQILKEGTDDLKTLVQEGIRVVPREDETSYVLFAMWEHFLQHRNDRVLVFNQVTLSTIGTFLKAIQQRISPTTSRGRTILRTAREVYLLLAPWVAKTGGYLKFDNDALKPLAAYTE